MVLPGATDALVPGTTGAVSISSSMPETGAGNDKIRAPSVPVSRTSAADPSASCCVGDGSIEDAGGSTDEGAFDAVEKTSTRVDVFSTGPALVGSPSVSAGAVSPGLTHCCGELSAASSATEAMRAQTDDLRLGRIRRRTGRPTH